MITDRKRPIVVGVDGSDEALTATRWAAREADRRGTSVRLLAAVPWKTFRTLGPSAFEPDELREITFRVAREYVERAAVEATGALARDRIDYDVRSGTPTKVLRNASESAGLLVVGDRGRGGVSGLLAGSVAVSVAAAAHCPTVVVRGTQGGSDAPVVVGADGSDEGEAALDFAFEEASTRGAELIALHTWNDEVVDPTIAELFDREAIERHESEVLDGALALWRRKYPKVVVQPRLLLDRPAPALVAASAGAQLVVVGSRGHGELVGTLLGSVSRAVVHHSHCPVAVVRRHGTAQHDT